MEGPNAWTLATRAAGRTAFGASFFPLALPLAYAATGSPGSLKAVAVAGLATLSVAGATTLACMAAGGRRAWPASGEGMAWLGGAAASLVAQAILAVAVGSVWASLAGRRG